MISIKAIAAISLTGLGAAAMSADVYLASHATTAPPDITPEPPRTFHPLVVPKPAPAPVATVLTLEPIAIFASAPAPRAVHRISKPGPGPRELVPCSEWRALESGPAGHRVQTLCVPH